MFDWSALGAAIGSGVAAVLARQAHKSSGKAHDSAAQAVRMEEYLHTRMHDVLSALFGVRLGIAALLRAQGINIPDPEPPQIRED